MPYKRPNGDMERARSIGHVPIVENPVIQERLRSFRIFTEDAGAALDAGMLTPASSLPGPIDEVAWAMAFDGSPQEVAVREKYPSTRVGYIQVAGVLVHLKEMLTQEKAHLVDPQVIKETTQESLHSMVLPGSNVCRKDMPTVADSWRAEVYEIFRDYSVEQLPLLDVYMALIARSSQKSASGVSVTKCASAGCDAEKLDVPRAGMKCPKCQIPIFPTDALRIHEEVLEQHANQTALGRLMSVLEHVTMAAYLNFLWQRKPEVLRSVAFVLDGPLAMFGPPAWLHSALSTFINELMADLGARSLAGPVIVGLEKTGQFAEHANAIRDRLPNGTLMMLPDDYIFARILASRPSSNSAFGRDTYYGQKFFYKTAKSQMLTISVPKPAGNVTNPHHPRHYPGLASTLALLDRIGTSLYEDAVIPVALAHSFASIPLRTGSKVLTLLSRELLGLNG